MADPGNLSSNPFAALFPSVEVAEQYSVASSEKYDKNKQSGMIRAPDENQKD